MQIMQCCAMPSNNDSYSVGLTVINDNAQPVLLRLQQLLVDSDLHVQGDLDVQEVLVLLQLLAQLVQKSLDLGILGSNL